VLRRFEYDSLMHFYTPCKEGSSIPPQRLQQKLSAADLPSDPY